MTNEPTSDSMPLYTIVEEHFKILCPGLSTYSSRLIIQISSYSYRNLRMPRLQLHLVRGSCFWEWYEAFSLTFLETTNSRLFSRRKQWSLSLCWNNFFSEMLLLLPLLACYVRFRSILWLWHIQQGWGKSLITVCCEMFWNGRFQQVIDGHLFTMIEEN